MRRLSVQVSDEAYRRLIEVAREERRALREQAGWELEKAFRPGAKSAERREGGDAEADR